MILRRTLVVLALALALAAPSAARDGAPEELWRAFPLEPRQSAGGSPLAPLAPPVPREAPLAPPVPRDVPPSAAVAVVSTGDESAFEVWWVFLAATLVAVPIAVVVVRRRLEAIPARAAVAAWSREPSARRPESPLLQRFARAAEASRVGPAAPVECVVRREGVVRSRFVAELEPHAGRQRTIAISRSFWRRGHGERADYEAREAWDDLIGGLEAKGWELAPAWGAREDQVRRHEGALDDVRLVRAPRLALDPVGAQDD